MAGNTPAIEIRAPLVSAIVSYHEARLFAERGHGWMFDCGALRPDLSTAVAACQPLLRGVKYAEAARAPRRPAAGMQIIRGGDWNYEAPADWTRAADGDPSRNTSTWSTPATTADAGPVVFVAAGFDLEAAPDAWVREIGTRMARSEVVAACEGAVTSLQPR